MTQDTEPTIQDVLIAINQFSTDIDDRFVNIDAELTTIKSTMVTKDHFETELAIIKNVMVTKDYLHEELGKLKVTMVTKDYLDDKLSDLRGEFFLKTGLLKKRTA